MQSAPLGEVCTINPSPPRQLAADGTCSFVAMEAVDEVEGRIRTVAARAVGEVSKGYTAFAENDVLLAKITPCMENGKCAIARNLLNGIGFGSTEFHVLRPSEFATAEWLFYFWRFPGTRRLAKRHMTGSAGQKRVPEGFLETLAIPIPGVPEQRRLSAILERADRVRRIRRYALELSDTFLAATFLEMFGDSLRHSAKWPRVPVSELCESIIDCVNKTAPTVPGPTPFKMIRTSNVRRGRISTESVSYVDEETYARWTRRSVPRKGDIILTREAPLGEVGIVDTDERIFLGQRLVQYRVNSHKSNGRYLLHALMSPDVQAQLRGLGAGSTVEHVAVPDCEALAILEPPRSMQEKFTQIVRHQERLYLQASEAVRQADHLFQSLLYRTFTTSI